MRINTPHLRVTWICATQYEAAEATDSSKTERCEVKGRCHIVTHHDGRELTIVYTAETDFSNVKIHRWLQERMKRAIIETANRVLPLRVAELELYSGLKAKKLTIKKLRKAYGRCFANGQIQLDPIIAVAPQEFADEVILHELTHLVHFNHGKKFWELLSKLTGHDAKSTKSIDDIGMSPIWIYCKYILK